MLFWILIIEIFSRSGVRMHQPKAKAKAKANPTVSSVSQHKTENRTEEKLKHICVLVFFKCTSSAFILATVLRWLTLLDLQLQWRLQLKKSVNSIFTNQFVISEQRLGSQQTSCMKIFDAFLVILPEMFVSRNILWTKKVQLTLQQHGGRRWWRDLYFRVDLLFTYSTVTASKEKTHEWQMEVDHLSKIKCLHMNTESQSVLIMLQLLKQTNKKQKAAFKHKHFPVGPLSRCTGRLSLCVWAFIPI